MGWVLIDTLTSLLRGSILHISLFDHGFSSFLSSVTVCSLCRGRLDLQMQGPIPVLPWGMVRKPQGIPETKNLSVFGKG